MIQGIHHWCNQSSLVVNVIECDRTVLLLCPFAISVQCGGMSKIQACLNGNSVCCCNDSRCARNLRKPAGVVDVVSKKEIILCIPGCGTDFWKCLDSFIKD